MSGHSNNPVGDPPEPACELDKLIRDARRMRLTCQLEVFTDDTGVLMRLQVRHRGKFVAMHSCSAATVELVSSALRVWLSSLAPQEVSGGQ